MLCERCTSIFSDDALEHWLSKTSIKNGYVVVSGEKWLEHHATASALREAAAAGCFICSGTVHRFPDLASGTVYSMSVFTKTQAFNNVEVMPIGAKDKLRRAMFHLEAVDETSKVFELSNLSLAESSTGGRHCLDLAKYWLDECCRRHQRCRAGQTPERYPTRLLSIDGDLLRLVTTEDEKPHGYYATLSHCWGTHPIDVLTPSNNYDFTAGRRIQDLPPSFRDFCNVCQHLNIRYVWIDSFCILQGSSPESVQDWERESLLMETVYANSLLNIGASHASSSQDGCFQPRPGFVQTHFLHWKASTNEPSQMYALTDFHRDRNTSFNNLHLFSRAWVVQERLLSPRMLHFGKDQLWWQCAEAPLLCEQYPGSGWKLTCPSINTLRPAGIEEYQGNLNELWNGIMTVYSGCGITKPHTDKQRAIQGIGNRIARITDDVFVEGFLWKQLPRALCWQVTYEAREVGRARKYRAPSWSWVSMDCPLYFDESMNKSKAGDSLAAAICTGQHDTRRFLVCVGKLLPLTWSPKSTDSQIRLQIADLNDTLTCTMDDLDVSETAIRAMDLAFLPIFVDIDEEPPILLSSIVGIVLSRCEDGSWSRIGMSYTGSYKIENLLSRLQVTRGSLVVLV
ncbi:hypothetical protein PRZ48_006452 [Zasmidium cellare]|uniref:Heterokaryon incompatibility domain-containing protein n=1 Tax=Zasmidium cellare TaxID=395010 RepID=A0ABR0EPD0_ZASCE|nr:hypothetical protein PRZ48_006452 [Zasmidium cellare]